MTSILIDRADGLSSAVALKGPCRVATTANIALMGLQTIDGVSVVANDRVLVKDQTSGIENGIWVVDPGVWRRAKDFNRTKDVVQGTQVFVLGGTYENRWFAVTTANPISIGVSNIQFELSDDVAAAEAAQAAAEAARDVAIATVSTISTIETHAFEVELGDTSVTIPGGYVIGGVSTVHLNGIEIDGWVASNGTTVTFPAIAAEDLAEDETTATMKVRVGTPVIGLDLLDNRYLPTSARYPYNDIRTYEAVGDGTTDCQAFIEAACAAQTGRVIGTTAFSAIPQAPVIDLIIPAGVWHVAGLVDTGGKNVTYFVDEAAVFTSGSIDNLNSAKMVRKNRVTSNFVSGVLDSACARSTMAGDGAADRSPLVNGITNINQIGTVDTFDAVSSYTDITSVNLLHTTTATFTSTTCTLAVAANAKKLRVGMVILTDNAYAGQILSWNAGGTVITVTGWYPIGSTTPGTPAAATVFVNPISEIYAHNTNVFLTSTGYTFQGTGHETGIINNKVAPSTAEDSAGKTWAYDAVNLGGFRCSMGFIARGDWYEGYRATGVQKGFVAKAYALYGYAAPLIGFEYQGDGVGWRVRNAAGTIQADLDALDGKLRAQKLSIYGLVNAVDDAAASAAGIEVGGFYRNGSQVMVRVT